MNAGAVSISALIICKQRGLEIPLRAGFAAVFGDKDLRERADRDVRRPRLGSAWLPSLALPHWVYDDGRATGPHGRGNRVRYLSKRRCQYPNVWKSARDKVPDEGSKGVHPCPFFGEGVHVVDVFA